MAQSWGKRQTFIIEDDAHVRNRTSEWQNMRRAPADRPDEFVRDTRGADVPPEALRAFKVTLPELRLEIAVERPASGGGDILVIRSTTGEPVEILPSTANTVGVRRATYGG